MKFQIDLQIITDELEEPIKTDREGAYISSEHEAWKVIERIKDAVDNVMGVEYIFNIDLATLNDEESVEQDIVEKIDPVSGLIVQ